MVNTGKLAFSASGKAWGPLSGITGGRIVTPPVGFEGISPLEPWRRLKNVKIKSKTPVRLEMYISIVGKKKPQPLNSNPNGFEYQFIHKRRNKQLR